MIEIDLDVVLAMRKMSSLELSEKIGITPANLSILKTGKAKAIRFSTLEAICKTLNCQPGDIIKYIEDNGGKCNIIDENNTDNSVFPIIPSILAVFNFFVLFMLSPIFVNFF